MWSIQELIAFTNWTLISPSLCCTILLLHGMWFRPVSHLFLWTAALRLDIFGLYPLSEWFEHLTIIVQRWFMQCVAGSVRINYVVFRLTS